MKKFVLTLILSLFALLFGCDAPAPSANLPESEINRPDDFSFSLVWGVYGISYYNSESCSLVKTTDATNPEDYVSTMRLSSEDLDEIYAKISEHDMDSYPEKYDPFDNVMSSPSQTIILTCGDNKIVCENICLGYGSNNKKGQKFLDTVKFIIDKVTATEEWQSFPEYEFFYD